MNNDPRIPKDWYRFSNMIREAEIAYFDPDKICWIR